MDRLKPKAYPIKEMIGEFLKESNLKPVYSEEKLKANWESIVGRTMAKYTKSVKLSEDGILTVTLSNSTVKAELKGNASDWISRINTFLSDNLVKSIHVF